MYYIYIYTYIYIYIYIYLFIHRERERERETNIVFAFSKQITQGQTLGACLTGMPPIEVPVEMQQLSESPSAMGVACSLWLVE